MAQVSVTEAARLTGKSRRTIQRHIATGKLSVSQRDATGKSIETSELIRVFGEIKHTHPIPKNDNIGVTMSQHVAMQSDKKEVENELLKQEVALLKQRLEDKDAHIDSLKQAMLLIESKQPTTPEPVLQPAVKKSWQFWKR